MSAKIPLLLLLSANEKNIGELYTAYSKKFPEKKKLWQEIITEEKEHAQILQEAHYKLAKNKTPVNEKNFSRRVIKYVADYIKSRHKILKEKNISLKSALKSAIRLERSMLEKKCLETFEPTNAELLSVFRRLNRDVEKHIRKFSKAFEKEFGEMP